MTQEKIDAIKATVARIEELDKEREQLVSKLVEQCDACDHKSPKGNRLHYKSNLPGKFCSNCCALYNYL